MDKENCNAAFSGGNLFCPLLGAAQTYRKAKKVGLTLIDVGI